LVKLEDSQDELIPDELIRPSEEKDSPSLTESGIARNKWVFIAKFKTFEPLHLYLRYPQDGHIMKDCPLPNGISNYSWLLQQLLME
jgi:hypothetical protein